MNLRRLEKFLNYLQKMPKERRAHFDMKTWVASRVGNSGGSLRDGIESAANFDCGTSCCAWGGFCVDTMKPEEAEELLYAGDGFHHAAEYFGISVTVSFSIFAVSFYPAANNIQPSDVAKRVKALLKKGTP